MISIARNSDWGIAAGGGSVCLLFNILKRRSFMISQIVRYKWSIPVALWMAASASAVLAQANDFRVQGSLAGHGIGVIEGGTLRATASGEGSASEIGRFTYGGNATVDLVTGNSTGVFLLVFSNGDVIYGSFTGHGGPTADPNMGEIVE